MNRKQQIYEATGKGDKLTAEEKKLLAKFKVELYPGSPKALLVTGTNKVEPTQDEIAKIDEIVTKTGRELHHLRFQILKDE